jgi:hypothetical protein
MGRAPLFVTRDANVRTRSLVSDPIAFPSTASSRSLQRLGNLTKAEESKDCEYDDDCADEPNDVVHVRSFQEVEVRSYLGWPTS